MPAGARGLGQQAHGGGRRPRRPIVGMDDVAPAGGVAAVLAEELPRARIQQADVLGVPLDRDLGPEPARGRAVVRVVDLDAAVEMDGAGAERVVAKRRDGQRPPRGPLLGEHRRDLTLGGAVDARVGPARVPAIEVGLRRLERLEAQPLEGGLRVPDGRLHLALAIGIADATGQRDDAVVRQHVAVERIQGGVVEVRREHALPEIVEDDDVAGATKATEGLLMQLAPAACARGEGQQADAFAAVAEREDEEPRAAVLARPRMAHHRAVTVIDLAFLAGRRDDHGVRLGRPVPAQRDDEAAHAGVLGGKAVVVDEIPPDGHRVAAAGEGELDQFAVRRAGAGRGCALRPGRPRRRRGVGGHLFGRICRRVAPPPGRPHGDPGGLEIGPGRLAPHARRRFNAAQRPAQLAEGNDLLLFRVAQDVGHGGGGTTIPLAASTSRAPNSYGRFSGVHLWPVLGVHRGQQGAWVIPRIEREFLFRMGRGPENLVSFAVFDYGQSLAVEVVTRAELNTFEEWPRALAEPRLASRVMIPPKTSINQTVGIVTIDNETQMASIASERRKIIIWARLTYMDGVNTNGESYFCRVYSPVIKKFAFCPEDKPWGRDWAK